MTALAWVILAYAAIVTGFAALILHDWRESLKGWKTANDGWSEALDLVAESRRCNSMLISSLLKSIDDEPVDELAAKRNAK